MMQSNTFADKKVSDLLEPVTTFSSNDPISRVLGYLRETRQHEAIIRDSEGVSIVSIRDMLTVENVTTEKLTHVMKQVPKFRLEDKLSNAAKLMLEYRIRTIPVFDGAKLVGKISSSAIAKSLINSENAKESIGRIATPNPICINVSDSAAKAKRLIVDRKIDQLPILKDRRLVGVVSADSIIQKILPRTDRSAVGERRTGRMEMEVSVLSDPQTVSNDVTDSLKTTLENMLRAGSNYSVIMGAEEVQGLVTYHDFLKLLPLGNSEQIPVSIVGLPDDPMQSEMAKEKFQNAIKSLSRAWPHLQEARAIIKSGETKAPKKKYHVQVFLTSESSHHNYEIYSYDLAKAFEEIELWIKKLTERHGEKRSRKNKRQTTRRRVTP